jgi:3-carboxy-cis,cis-muconate cycloisomerase
MTGMTVMTGMTGNAGTSGAGGLDGAAGSPEAALDVAARFASILGLRPAPLAWHTTRLPVADLAGALGTAAGLVGKVAGDLVLLAQTEVGEVREGVRGRGASSTIAHKQNPVAAISARAASLRAPGLVATLFACMAQEHERAAGAWHAEWRTLSELFVVTGSAATWLQDALSHLVVDSARMLANLGTALGPTSGPEDLGVAGLLVDRVLAARS